jgi:uracil-DNA glycosylase
MPIPLRTREGGGDVTAAPACACRWVLRMETEVQRRVWMYVLLALGSVLAGRAQLVFASAPRYADAMDVEAGYLYARKKRQHVKVGYMSSALPHRRLRDRLAAAYQCEETVRAHRDLNMT